MFQQRLASSSGLLAKSGLEKLQKLELDKKYSETRQRVSQGVQELQLGEKYSETRQRVSQGVQELHLGEKYDASKQRFAQEMSKLQLEEKITTQRERLRNVNIKANLQKLNIAKLIDGMEKDQNVADNLERKNRDYVDEQRAREMMREAELACQEAIASHLEAFLQEHPTATYEEWIQDLHPENMNEGKLLGDGFTELDHRLYVEESDHRRLWNKNLGDGLRRAVPPRSRMKARPEDLVVVDLLDDTGTTTGTTSTQALNSPLATAATTDSNDDADESEGMFDVSLMTTTPAAAPAAITSAATPTSPAAAMTALETNLFAADPDVETRSTVMNGLQDKVNNLMGVQPPDQAASWATEATSGSNDNGEDLINFDDFL